MLRSVCINIQIAGMRCIAPLCCSVSCLGMRCVENTNKIRQKEGQHKRKEEGGTPPSSHYSPRIPHARLRRLAVGVKCPEDGGHSDPTSG